MQSHKIVFKVNFFSDYAASDCVGQTSVCGGAERRACCGQLRCVTPLRPVVMQNEEGVCMDCPFVGDACSTDSPCCSVAGLACSGGRCVSLIVG